MSALEPPLRYLDLADLDRALSVVREKIAAERSAMLCSSDVRKAGRPPEEEGKYEADLTAKAAAIYSGRRARDRAFDDPSLFSDPAWDIMLDLFIAKNQHLISVSSACIAAAVAPTTALRWIDILIKKGLVERTPDQFDRRRTFVRLTKRGEELVGRAVKMA